MAQKILSQQPAKSSRQFVSPSFAFFRHIVFCPRRMTDWIQTALLCLTILAAARSPAQQTGIGYKPAADANSKKTILLKDFQPEPALHAATHEIERAKFSVIDVHTHTNDAAGIGDRVDPKEMIARTDRLNIWTLAMPTAMRA